MTLWLVEHNDNHYDHDDNPNSNNEETRRRSKSTLTEAPSRRPRPTTTTTTPALGRLEQALKNFVENLEPLEEALLCFEDRLVSFEEALVELEEGAAALNNEERAPKHQPDHQAKHQHYHQQQHPPRLLLSPPEVCRELGVDRGMLYRRLSSGEIPSLRLGDAVKVRRADLEEYMRVRDMKGLKGKQRHLRLVVGGEGVNEAVG